MEIAEVFLRRNGHMIRHRYDAAAKDWIAADPIPEPALKPFRPMLANIYSGAIMFPAMCQPKLDGIRCIAKADGLFSRDGNRIETQPHIVAALAPIFTSDPNLIIDGELWAEGMTLGEIAAHTRRKSGESPLAFHAFDTVADEPFADRIIRLNQIVASVANDAVALVETTVCATEAELDAHYRNCLAGGFEGQMIRNPGAGYQQRRCGDLLKRKPIEDDEAEIISTEIRNCGRIVLGLRGKDGIEFAAPAPMKGRDRRRFARIGSALTGLDATYRYSGRLPSGKPRDPVVKLIHELPRF